MNGQFYFNFFIIYIYICIFFCCFVLMVGKYKYYYFVCGVVHRVSRICITSTVRSSSRIRIGSYGYDFFFSSFVNIVRQGRTGIFKS